MNSSESSQLLRDPRQITFVMLNRFWSLSKNPFTPPHPSHLSFPFLMDNIRLHGMPTTGFEKILLWKVTRYSYQFFYFLFYISFYISRYYFYNFLEFHSTLSERTFCPKFSFFDEFTTLPPQPHHLNGQNLLNVTKFLLICPKMSSEIFFFQKFTDKILKSIF